MTPDIAPLDLRRTARIRPLRDALFVAGGALLCGCVALISVAMLARRALVSEVHDGLARVATAAAGLIDGDAHSALLASSQWGSPEYERAIRPLRRLHAAAPDIAYVYTLRLIDGLPHFVLDTAKPGDGNHDGVDDHSYLMDPYDEADSHIYVALAEDRTVVTPEPFTDAWGTFMSAYAPFHDSTGRIEGVVGIDMDLHAYRARLGGVQRAASIGSIGALTLALVIGLLVWRQQRGALRSTEQSRQLTEALELARRDAQSASDSKSQFLANVSHELRTPMTAIIGFGDLLLEPGQDDSQRREHAATIRRNACQLLDLINDLLDLSRIEAQTLELDSVEYSPAQLIKQTVDEYQARASARGLKLGVAWDSPLPAGLKGDPKRLRQVLTNLVGNALKFTPSGSVTVCVAFEQRPAPRLKIAVRDTGIGIAPPHLAIIFEPFTQADGSTSRRFGGTGIGLALCRRLTEAMGGGIEAASDGAGGSTFTFWIAAGCTGEPRLFDPVALLQHGTEPRPSLPADRRADSEIRLEGRVLLAEDGRDNQILVKRLLARTGLVIETADDGIEALEKLEAEAAAGRPFDLLLTDIQMPRLDGLGLTRRLRAQGSLLPIVALTAHALPLHRDECLAAGCNGYAAKPINPRQLLEAIADALNAARHGPA